MKLIRKYYPKDKVSGLSLEEGGLLAYIDTLSHGADVNPDILSIRLNKPIEEVQKVMISLVRKGYLKNIDFIK